MVEFWIPPGLLQVHVSEIRGSVEAVVSRAESNRLQWRSRRGLLELELLLVPFVRERYAELPHETQVSYAKLLECEDLDIYDWLQGRSQPTDDSLAPVIALICEHNSR